MPKAWTVEEVEYLRLNYPTTATPILCEALNRSTHAVTHKANRISVEKLQEGIDFSNCRKSNVQILAHDASLETFYWAGFLLADGSFINNESIKLSVSSKDAAHLQKFADYIATTSIYSHDGIVSINVMNKDVVPVIMDRFGLTSRKTYNPPNLSKYDFTREQMLAMTIGFIDGDGSITVRDKGYPAKRITIEVHASWASNLEFILSYAHDSFSIPLTSTVRVNARGYAVCAFKDSVYRELKSFANSKKLPVLIRKWGG